MQEIHEFWSTVYTSSCTVTATDEVRDFSCHAQASETRDVPDIRLAGYTAILQLPVPAADLEKSSKLPDF